LLTALMVVLRRSYRWTRTKITRAAQSWHWDSGLARLRLLSPETVAGTTRSFVATVAWLIALLLVYFYLEFTLSLFPWTRGIADSMVQTSRGAVIGALTSLAGYLPSLLNIIVIVFIARLALKILRRLFEQVQAQRINLPNFYPEWALPTYSLVRFFLLAVSAVMIFPYLPGSGSEGFKGVSVFVGLLISLGAASAIANLIAGIVITYMRPFKVGDRVKIADAVGDVMSKDLFVVRVRTTKNVDITIPNSLVLANHIINYSSSADSAGLVLHTTVTIGYDVPWQQVEQLLLAAARKVEGILAEPEPYVLQTSLDDFFVSYELNAYTNRPNEMARLYSRLHTEIQNSFNEAGVEIMSPYYAAVRDGNRAALPDEHLPKDYRTPGFNVFSQILRPGGGS
jgi:small-conductance mechanosensitive channel